jgi:2-keto-3-deoxy-L-rhamnonate aldolase RhmA
MNGRELKDLWNSGQPSIGAWVTLTDPAVAAMMGNLGFDWLFIDAEHNPFNPEVLRTLLVLLRDRNVATIVRVRKVDEALAKQVLDWGATGVMFPMVRSAADAGLAVASCRYPPAGIRGFNPREASNYFKDLDHYLLTANDHTVVVLQVEHADAVNNLAQIAQIPGIDSLMIGPADLSYSLGVPLQRTHATMQAAIETTIRIGQAAGIPVGMTWEDSDAGYADFLRRGLAYISPYADTDFLTMAGGKWLESMRKITCDLRAPAD